MKKLALVSSLLMGLFATSAANASIGVDNMLKFAENGQAFFNVTNLADYHQFIQVGISSVKVEKGEIIEVPYTKENISDWRLSAIPARAMIEPKYERKFGVSFKAKNAAENQVDQVFQLTIIPTPYFKDGQKPQHAMQIAVGFAPYVIVPAVKDQPMSYEISREKDKLVLKNNGKTYVRATLDACPAGTRQAELEKCMKRVHAISGRNLSLDLNEEFQKAKNIKVRLSTHNAKYKEEFELSTGQKRRV